MGYWYPVLAQPPKLTASQTARFEFRLRENVAKKAQHSYLCEQ